MFNLAIPDWSVYLVYVTPETVNRTAMSLTGFLSLSVIATSKAEPSFGNITKSFPLIFKVCLATTTLFDPSL